MMPAVPKPFPKVKKRKHGKIKPITKGEMDKKWSYLIKLKAGFKSEISNKSNGVVLNAHHINGKETYTLRYSLISGIVLTYHEHSAGIHNPNRAERYRELIKQAKGQDIYDRLEKVRENSEKLSLSEINSYLDYHINLFENGRRGDVFPIIKKGEWLS